MNSSPITTSPAGSAFGASNCAVSPASWRYHPEQQARVEAREELADGRVLMVGKRGERWLYDPRSKRLEAGASLAPDDLVAVLRGPVVLAADLGPSSDPYTNPAPAFVGDAVLDDFAESEPAVYEVAKAARPEALTLRPFFDQYERRSAVYSPALLVHDQSCCMPVAMSCRQMARSP